MNQWMNQSINRHANETINRYKHKTRNHPVGLLVLPCTRQSRRPPPPLTPSPHFPPLSRTEEPAKAVTCARDRRALQQLALKVHVKHSDLTWPDLTRNGKTATPTSILMRILLKLLLPSCGPAFSSTWSLPWHFLLYTWGWTPPL